MITFIFMTVIAWALLWGCWYLLQFVYDLTEIEFWRFTPEEWVSSFWSWVISAIFVLIFMII